MPELNRGLDALCAEIDSMLLAKNGNSGIGIQAPKGTDTAVDQPCVCNARVICTNATADSEPVHMKKDGERVELSGRAELTKKDILMETPFAGCKTTEDKICGVKAKDIEDREWQGVDETKSQGQDMETLKAKESYMVCTKGWGMIYFVDAGQKCKDFINEISMDELQSLKLVKWLKYIEIGNIHDTSNPNYIKINGIYYIAPQNSKDGYVTLGYGHAIQTNDEAKKYGFFNVQGYENFDFSKKRTIEEIDNFIDKYYEYYGKSILCPGIMSQESATLTLLDDLKLTQKRVITAIGGISEKDKYTVNEFNALTSILYNGNDYDSPGSLSYYLIKSNGNYTKEDALNVVEEAEKSGEYKKQGEGIFRRRLMEINIYYNGDYTFYDDTDMEDLKEAVGCTLP